RVCRFRSGCACAPAAHANPRASNVTPTRTFITPGTENQGWSREQTELLRGLFEAGAEESELLQATDKVLELLRALPPVRTPPESQISD
ncbi:MAG: hypothetical protein AB7O59_18625, partial [Pirellulales bacterium]